jgi:two-component system, cell cycle response regulator DivK
MSGELVLVVDDNLANMKLMSFLLAKRGYQVRSASSAKDALEVLRTFFPRLILMDLQMAGVDGFALTRQLKAATATRDIVVIAVTANAMKGDEQRAIEAGCDDYVTKPIDTRALPALVAAHLSKPRREAR